MGSSANVETLAHRSVRIPADHFIIKGHTKPWYFRDTDGAVTEIEWFLQDGSLQRTPRNLDICTPWKSGHEMKSGDESRTEVKGMRGNLHSATDREFSDP